MAVGDVNLWEESQRLCAEPANELVCEDCLEGDHEACRRAGGWPHQDTNERCGCHDTAHLLDNRAYDVCPRCGERPPDAGVLCTPCDQVHCFHCGNDLPCPTHR